MYTLINQYSNQIVQKIGDSFISDYERLITDLNTKDVSNNHFYQRDFKKFWAMNAARLSQDYLDEYFNYLEQNKNNNQINVRQVCEYLYRFPTDNQGRQSVQFSFATKLVHMVNTDMPIYDQQIRTFYFLKAPNTSNYRRKLAEYVLMYDFLVEEYQRIIDNNYLDDAIQAFRNQLNPNVFSQVKIIDSLIWKFVGMAKDSSFLLRYFEYS